MNYLSLLGGDVFREILKYLNEFQLIKFASISKKYRSIIYDKIDIFRISLRSMIARGKYLEMSLFPIADLDYNELVFAIDLACHFNHRPMILLILSRIKHVSKETAGETTKTAELIKMIEECRDGVFYFNKNYDFNMKMRSIYLNIVFQQYAKAINNITLIIIREYIESKHELTQISGNERYPKKFREKINSMLQKNLFTQN